MANPVVSQSPTKPRRWLRRLTLGAAALLALLLVTYFVVTSAAFLKGVILPKVGSALHATITISGATISPFSQVALRDLKVQTTGSEPLVTAQEARVHYSLWDILGGRLKVAEVTLNAPTVTIVRNADGTSNLDPILQSAAGTPAKPESAPPSKPSEPGQPVQIDLSKFALNNATVRLITQHPGGGRDLVELSKVNVTLDNLKNGQTGKVAVTADLGLDNQPPAPASHASLQGKFESSFEITLGSDLSLSACKGRGRLQAPQATGSLSPISGFSLSFETDVSADPAKQSAVLRSFKLEGARQQTPMLQAVLSSPLTFSWGGGDTTSSDSSLSLLLTNIHLADWKGFAPDLDAAGRAHATVQLSSQASGQRLGLNLAAAVEGLSGKFGTNTLADLDLMLSARGEALHLKQLKVAEYRLTLTQRQAPILSIGGTLEADTQANTAQVQARLEAHLQRLLQLSPQPGLTLGSGLVQLDTKLGRQGNAMTVGGTLGIQSLSGSLDDRPFRDLSAGATYDLALANPQQMDLRRLQLTLAPTDRARTNAAELSGRIDLTHPKAIEGALKLTSDTLDITSYYDLLADSPATRPKPTPSAQPAPTPPTPSPTETEPPALALPVKLLTLETTIGRCYLREIALSNLMASVRVEGSRVTIEPVSFALNGAPVTAAVELNLGVPGYQYSVGFNANRIPLEPIANSFSPAYRGQAKGEVLAALNLKGAGLTGPSLQKNLAGALNLSFTNAEIQLVGQKAKGWLTPIALALGYNDLFKSPLRWVGADATVNAGKLNLSQFSLVSPAFTAGTRGEIPLAAKLTESPIRNWPVDFALPRSWAEKLKLTPKDTSASNEFVALPNLVKAIGTVGNAETKVDSKALLQFGARALTDLPGVGQDASKLINQADSLLGGRLTGRTNAPSTNAPSTNTNTLPRKLGDLFKPKTKP